MGRVMDRIMASIDLRDDGASLQIRDDLELIAAYCRWTSGTWDALNLRWNEIQNVPRHTNELSNYLIRLYVQSKSTRR